MLSSAPRIVKVTVTPILISDPPLLNILGAHQPYTPGSIVETKTSDGVVGIGETHGSRDQPDEEIAAVHALVPARLHERFNRTPQCHNRDDAAAMWHKHPDWTQPPPAAVVTPAGQNPTHEGEQ